MENSFRAKLARHSVPADDADFLADLASRSTASVEARDELFGHAAERDSLYILLTGWACKFRLLSDGRRQIGPIHLPGDICNLDALSGGGSPHGVLALTSCRVAAVRRDVMIAASVERPALAAHLTDLLVAENAAMARQIVNLGRRSARERAADLICDLLARLQVVGEASDNAIRCALTQIDMADHLGLSAVHTNRALKELKTLRLLGGRGSHYVVLDLPGLREMAGL